jgi:hypothetical protein
MRALAMIIAAAWSPARARNHSCRPPGLQPTSAGKLPLAIASWRRPAITAAAGFIADSS